MEHPKPKEVTSKSTPVSNQLSPRKDPWKIPLSALVDAYPKDFVLQYVVVPTALHIWWSVSPV